MKRVFGRLEVAFDIIYLVLALLIAGIFLSQAQRGEYPMFAGVMTLLLAGGDSFHLLPRIALALTDKEEKLRSALGRGKQITSITMTLFYLFLWEIGRLLVPDIDFSMYSIGVYFLVLIRIFLCFLPQNKWKEQYPPVKWAIIRNIPFFLLGGAIAAFYFIYRSNINGFQGLWIAIVLSFVFYTPVVLWSNRHPKVGMLMLPKTCTYLWMLGICLQMMKGTFH